MSVRATAAMNLSVAETIDTSVPALGAQNTIVHDGFTSTHTIYSSTTPPATKVAAFTKALVAGAATIDLTALTGTSGASVTFSGLKVQMVKIINPSTNVNPLVVVPGASNGYNLLGAAFKITLKPGEEHQFYLPEGPPDVAGGAKTLDLTDGGAGGTESSQWILVAG